MGTGAVKSEGTVKAVSRGGDRSASSCLCIINSAVQAGMLKAGVRSERDSPVLLCPDAWSTGASPLGMLLSMVYKRTSR